MKHQFKSRKEVSKFLKERGIDTSNWTEEKWLSINKSQAEIHIQAVAEAMWDALNESTPKQLEAGEWHIPFGDDIEPINVAKIDSSLLDINNPINTAIKIATARCARVSYTVVGEEGKEPNYENDIKLHDRLAESGHWSPAEHCAKAMDKEEHFNNEWSGNFKGFIQYRKTFEGENKV